MSGVFCVDDILQNQSIKIMNKRKYTFDTIHRDSFPRQFLIRFANSNDAEGDVFDTLLACEKALNNCVAMDVFVSLEILNSLK